MVPRADDDRCVCVLRAEGLEGTVKYIYVAGPISLGDQPVNIRQGIDAGLELLRRGFAPYIPHLDFLLRLIDPIPWERCLQWDEQWILKCDALLRLPGESKGADREVVFALQHGIPVYYSIEALGRATDPSAT